MIKLIAALLMLVDHIGALLFPETIWLRMVGRLSAPLFAYCIARGFLYSREHGSFPRYLGNMLLFSLGSQIPYEMMSNGLNIGFTWLFSLLLLKLLTSEKKTWKTGLAALSVLAAAYFLPIDYGLFGVAIPVVMYWLLISQWQPYKAFLAMIVLWAFFVFAERGSLLQVFYVGSLFIIMACRHSDARIILPKRFFYWFYPGHIIFLLLIRLVMTR